MLHAPCPPAVFPASHGATPDGESMQTMTNAAAPARGKRMARDYFFPTPVYYTDLAQAETLNTRLTEDIRAWRERDPGGTFRSNVPQLGGWHSATDMHLRAEFTALTHEIFELIHGVFTDQGYDDAYEPACDSMWANVNPPGAFNRHHTHPHALWSGVYYVQTPDDCGLLCLTDPRPQAHVITPYFDPKRRSAHTWSEVYHQPRAGRLVAFPGWLVHSTQPNMAGRSGSAGESAGEGATAPRPSRDSARTEPESPMAGREAAAGKAEADGPALERISVSFNFRQRRKGLDPAAAPANEVVRADLPAR